MTSWLPSIDGVKVVLPGHVHLLVSTLDVANRIMSISLLFIFGHSGGIVLSLRHLGAIIFICLSRDYLISHQARKKLLLFFDTVYKLFLFFFHCVNKLLL